MAVFMMKTSWIVLFCILHCDAFPQEKSAERRLYEDLLEGYNRKIRPVKNSSHSITVKVGVTLAQLLQLNAKDQLMSTIVYFDQEWKDEYLIWNPANYSGLQTIMVNADELWHSDITLYNSIGDFNLAYGDSLASVSYDGTVFFSPIVKLDSICSLDIALFPFDDQICTMKIASWMYSRSMVDIAKYKPTVEMSVYTESGEWDIVNTSAVRNSIYYPCCPNDPYPDVTFHFHLRRRRVYYIINLIVPCILLSTIAAFGILVPPETGEKVTVQVSIMMALMVYLVLLAGRLPETSDATPLIGIYLVVVSSMITFSTVFAMFISCVHFQDGRKRAPLWLRKIVFNFIAKIVCKRAPHFNIPPKSMCLAEKSIALGTMGQDSGEKCFRKKSSTNCRLPDKDETELLRSSHNNKPPSPMYRCRSNEQKVDFVNGSNVELENTDILSLGKATIDITRNARQLETIAEWRYISVILDRFFFVIVFSSTLSYTAYFLLSSSGAKSLI